MALKKIASIIKNMFAPKKLNVLLYGGAARDHALAWKLSQSKRLNKLYLVKPNDCFKHLGEVLEDSGFELVEEAKKRKVDLLIACNERALLNAIVNAFRTKGNIKTIGPTRYWTKLEASKQFAKEFMVRNSIKTPDYKIVTSFNDLSTPIKEFGFPLVLKFNSLVGGAGTFIAKNQEEAEKITSELLGNKFPNDEKIVIAEKYITGKEVSLMTLWDGKTLLPFVPAKDYKKLLENDEGPNTGSMGAYCPMKLSQKEEKQIDEYLKLLKKALIKEKVKYKGILYSGIMLNDEGVNILEYNVRLGDPEGQALMVHLESDLLDVFDLMTKGKLSKVKLKWKKGVSCAVVMASEDYPENTNTEEATVSNIDESEVEVFYSQIRKEEDLIKTTGGRVLTVCRNCQSSLKPIYNAIEKIDYKHKHYRKDIGKDIEF